MVIDNPEEVLRLALPEDHNFFHLFMDPIITNVYRPNHHADRIEIRAIAANNREYRRHQLISNDEIYRASREHNLDFGRVTIRQLSDSMVEEVQQDILREIRNQLLRIQDNLDEIPHGHMHNIATYLDEALRMPDNMSVTHTTVSPDATVSVRSISGIITNIEWIDREGNSYGRETEADKKARELLFSLLTEEQQEEYLEHKRIIVLSEKGNLYKVKRHCEQNVYLLNSNDPSDWNTRYCAGISDTGIPLDDRIAAQLLMLQGNEEEFIRIANVMDSRLPEEELRLPDPPPAPSIPEPYRIYNGEACLGDGSRIRIDGDGIWRPVVET